MFFRFHRAQDIAIPQRSSRLSHVLNFKLYPPSLSHRSLSSFPVVEGRWELDNTVLHFAKCLIQSWRRRLRAKTIILMLARIKKERRVATLRPHNIMPLSVVPLRPLLLAYFLYPILLVLSLRYNTRSLGFRVFVHQFAHQFPRYSTILSKNIYIIALHGKQSKTKSLRNDRIGE